MNDVKQTMMGLLVTSLRVANGLLRAGHEPFGCFAVALRADGGCICTASTQADFVLILALLPGTVEVTGATTAEPATETECLAVEDEDDAEEAVVARLRHRAELGEVVATAVIEVEPDWDHPSGPQTTVWVKLEHRSDWTLLYTQPYTRQGGEFQAGEAATYEHEAEVFVQ
ncbi:hypothetical protein [Fimbriiglobus ruber]|uniref:Uncharacterized protein n=1 Tax=Fimbriiglobus ruber TaxID=1908690 RepID=A0A225E5K4_9BACT|nr:hypothetical protein [Fimbriiglobus ruber]OWK47054.1 hypothetical protein FRUB_00753 [Fimbriiglobus ruber]